jgi:hypothetical protein
MNYPLNSPFVEGIFCRKNEGLRQVTSLEQDVHRHRPFGLGKD